MRTAKVISIFKSGEKHLFTNYSPISLSPQFSKIPEKLFAHRLDKCIVKHNLFSKKRTISMAVMELVEEIVTSIDKK